MKISLSIVRVGGEQVAELNYNSELAQVLTTKPRRCWWEKDEML